MASRLTDLFVIMLTQACSMAVMPLFAGLQHFYHSHNFKQWTGNDSKALMKVLTNSGYIVVVHCTNSRL